MKKALALLICVVLLFSTLPLPPSIKADAIVTVPTLGNDNDGGKVFEEGGNKYVLWGVDADSWGCDIGDTTMFTQHCQSLVYVNGNCIAIPITWRNVETVQNTYDFTSTDAFVNIAKNYGLKATILWLGSDYAAGDTDFIPSYIKSNPTLYSRITGAVFDQNNTLVCPSDPDTLNREKMAYYKLLEHLKSNNPVNTVMAINCGGESDYMRALPSKYWNKTPQLNVRCTCANCNSAYTSNLTNIQFMQQQYAKYIKAEIDYGKTIYDLPVYTQVCAYDFTNGWRYAENAAVIKSTVNRADHFCAPSVASTASVSSYLSEMNHFTSSNIPGNYIFTDGIDTGWSVNPPNIEVAPWMNILYYGGLGALYWDNPSASNIRTDTALRDKLRKFWGPLKGMEYQLALRKSTSIGKFWWYPDGQTHTWGSLSDFAVDRVSNGADYGTCFELGAQDICFAGSTYGGSYTFTVTRAGGFNNYKFEAGSFDPATGAWIKKSDVTPTVNGNNAVLTVSADSGDASSVVYRYYYSEPKINILKYQIAFNATLSSVQNPSFDFRSINGYNAFANVKVNAGDQLVYDVYIPADGNYKFGMGALDGQYNQSWGLIRTGDPKDKDGNSLYSDLAATYGTNRWITREIPLTASNEGIAHIGPGTILTQADAQSLAGKTATLYYRNIKVIHADNSVSPIYMNGGFVSDGVMASNISGSLGTVSLTEVLDQLPVYRPTERALEYKVVFRGVIASAPNPSVDIRSMNGYGAFAGVKVNTGDKLSYEVFVPIDGNAKFGMGAIDGQYNQTWGMIRASDPKDKNGNSLYTDLAGIYGTNQWITREIPLTASNEGIAHIGPGMILTGAQVQSLAGKTVTMYYKNIKVIHADNTESAIYENGGYLSSGVMESTIDGSLGTVSLTEINNDSAPAIFFKGYTVSNDNNYDVSNIAPLSTISSFRANVIPDSKTTLIYQTAGGNTIDEIAIANGAAITTGTSIVADNGIKTTIYTAIIFGDVSGDGAITLHDLVMMRDNVLGNQPLGDSFESAGDLYGEGTITLNDLVGMMAFLSSKGSIRQLR